MKFNKHQLRTLWEAGFTIHPKREYTAQNKKFRIEKVYRRDNGFNTYIMTDKRYPGFDEPSWELVSKNITFGSAIRQAGQILDGGFLK